MARKSKKSTRRNTGGRRSGATPPMNLGKDLERDMRATELAMDVAAMITPKLLGRSASWI
jgi:hypothetical protein